MHYIVTGGAGFIGSHLAEELARWHEVTILDNMSTGKLENVSGFVDQENVSFVEGSITDSALLCKLFSGADGIFHQAAIASVPQSIQNPEESNKVNVTGTLNVLTAARDNNVRKVVLASSSAVYGDDFTLPKTEDLLPAPLSPYAVTKIANEYYGGVFFRIYGLKTVFLRYFNVFGSRQDPQSDYAAVIPKFIQRIREGKPPVIFGDGKQTRDFTFIKDIVSANIQAMESDATGVYNIGCGNPLSINELASILMEIMGVNLETIHEAPRQGDIIHSWADISKAQETFGFSPKYDLRKGLEETVAWNKE